MVEANAGVDGLMAVELDFYASTLLALVAWDCLYTCTYSQVHVLDEI